MEGSKTSRAIKSEKRRKWTRGENGNTKKERKKKNSPGSRRERLTETERCEKAKAGDASREEPGREQKMRCRFRTNAAPLPNQPVGVGENSATVYGVLSSRQKKIAADSLLIYLLYSPGCTFSRGLVVVILRDHLGMPLLRRQFASPTSLSPKALKYPQRHARRSLFALPRAKASFNRARPGRGPLPVAISK